MTTIVTRAGKGSPLTNNEVDANFTNLNGAKIETLTSTDSSVTITGTGASRNLSVPVNPNVVSGPASATDNAVARYDGTTGKLIQNSVVTIDDAGGIENAIIDSFTNTVGADHIHYKIKANENIARGDVLKYVGWNAGNDAIEVVKTSSVSDVAIGMSDDDLTTGSFGLAVVVGTTEGFDTSAYTAGTILYSNGAGGLTATKPTTGTYQACAFVIRRQSVNGAYLVNFGNPVYVEATTNTANTAVIRDGSGNFSAGTITAALAGNATTATTLATGRTIGITGDLSYTSGAFNGSANVTGTGTLATVNANVGSFTNASVTVNAKGLVTAVSSGTAPVTSVTGTSPVVSSGGTTPAISMAAATASVNGYMTSTYAAKLDGIAAGATNVTNTNQLTNGAGYITSSGTSGNTSSISNAVGGVYTWTGIQYYASNRDTTSNSPPLQAYSNNGSGAIMSFHRGGYYAVNMGLDSDNVFRIGGWSAAANRWQLDMSGNGTYAGNVTAYSDERLKKNWRPVQDNFVSKLAKVKSGVYDRTDHEITQVGVSAQSLQTLIPEAVIEQNDGMLSVAYGNAAMVACVEMAKVVEELRAEIATLKAKVG